MNFIRSLRALRLRTAFVNQVERSYVCSRRSVPRLDVSQSRTISCINAKLFNQQISISALDNVSDANIPLTDFVSNDIIEESITVIGKGAPAAVKNFTDIEWPKEVSKVLEKKGFTKPTAIQANTWPVVLSGRDLVGIAKTGCGKTLAFLMPAISHIAQQINNKNRNERSPLALVLAPTRELTQQTYEVAKEFQDVITSIAVFGGASKNVQSNFISRHNPELIIATPGRLIDLVQSGIVDTSQVKYLVLDEADRMLDMGFEPQIRQIVRGIPEDRQTLMFSATWPIDVKDLANDFLNDFIQINVGSTELYANPNITQNIEILKSGSIIEKKSRLLSLLQNIGFNDDKMIIFVETKFNVDATSRWLRANRFQATGLHGGKTQMQRDNIMRDFRSGRCNILLATDVASRGLDVNDIKYVINFDFPNDIEDYVHRIGRTARANNKGIAYSFFSPEDQSQARKLIKILQQANQKVPPELEEMAHSKQLQAAYKKQSRYMYKRRNDGDTFQFEFKTKPNFRRPAGRY